MTKLLLVDDEEVLRLSLGSILRALDCDVVMAGSAEEARELAEGVDILVTDLELPGRNGFELMDEVRARDPSVPVVLLTGHGSERLAVEALKRGAHDYIAKPVDGVELIHSVQRAMQTRTIREQTQRRPAPHPNGVRVIGESPAFKAAMHTALRLATRNVTVLLRGETGTGKELFARALHTHSQRAERPFVTFNCGAVPHELAESELFGYAKGAFTGASRQHTGHFRQANGGTLVLDEIGELPLPLQAKLLRVLQEREVQPLGADRPERVDFRLVACTHRDLEKEVKAGRFREDLYYRIAVVELVVPPLRERRDDIPLLAREFARKYAERFGLDVVPELGPDFIERLCKSAWPGNVRQLESAVARSVALANGTLIGADALMAIEAPLSQVTVEQAADGTYRELMDDFERRLLDRTLRLTNGNRAAAARRLQMKRASLYDRLKRYELLPSA